MKKLFKGLSFVCVLALALSLIACGVKVSLNLTEDTMIIDETSKLIATVSDGKSVVTWLSSDENVASVNDGVVTAHNAGTTVITATVGKVSASATITVIDESGTEAQTVIDMISAINTKNPDEAAVTAAKAAYDQLSARAQAKVTNYATLQKLEKTVKAIADAKVVVALIEALPDAEEITLANREAVESAQEKYEALSTLAMSYVGSDNQDKMDEIIETMEDLVSMDETYTTRAANIDGTIIAIGGVDSITKNNISDKKDAVEAARDAYTKALQQIKDKIQQLPELEALEAKIKEVEKEIEDDENAASNVDSLIDAVSSEALLSEKEAVEAARRAYEALDDYAKKIVSKLDTLKKLETIITNREAALVIDTKIMALPAPDAIKATDETAIKEARQAFDGASAVIKEYLTQEKTLIAAEEALAYVKDPENGALSYIKKVYEGSYLTSDTVLMAKYYNTAITWAYKDGAANTDYYDIATGKILKATPYEFLQTTLVATAGSKTQDITFNVGIKGAENNVIVYTTGTAATKDGTATKEAMESACGFDGFAFIIEGQEDSSYAASVGNIYLAGKNALINLNETSDPDGDGYVEAKELMPYGSNPEGDYSALLNVGLLNGKLGSYKGTFFLYYNNGNTPLTFNPGWLYGRNSANSYGYTKIIFAPNGDGTYYLKQDIGESTNGTNYVPKGCEIATDESGNQLKDSSGYYVIKDNRTYTVTLQPGEYIICSHTYNTSASVGDNFCGRTGVLQAGITLRIVKYTVSL